jgi:hypothetical protein
VLRSIVGVVVGYAVFAASGFALFRLTGQPPHEEASIPFMVGAVLYGVAFALLCGYLSGWIAGCRPVAHAAVVAVILALGATASLVATLGKGAVWSQVNAIAVMAPAAVAGGWLRQQVAGPAEPQNRSNNHNDSLQE